MSRKKQPVAMLRANSSRHYTKQELAEREAAELKAPLPLTFSPPSYLPQALREKYRKTAATLVHMGVFSELDGDTLARYLIAETNYLRVTNRLTLALNQGSLSEAEKLCSMQDRFFRQCRAMASDLCLNISSRCSLVLPVAAVVEEAEGEGAIFGD